MCTVISHILPMTLVCLTTTAINPLLLYKYKYRYDKDIAKMYTVWNNLLTCKEWMGQNTIIITLLIEAIEAQFTMYLLFAL